MTLKQKWERRQTIFEGPSCIWTRKNSSAELTVFVLKFSAPIFVVLLLFVVTLIMPAVAFAQDFTPQIACWVCDPREYNLAAPNCSPVANPPIPGCRPEKPKYDGQCDKPVDPTQPPGPNTVTVRKYCKQGLLPFCARTKLGCTSIGDFGLVAINYGRFIFGISGSIALLFVIIGGMMMLFSFGNPEYMTKGKSTLIAAIIGLVIIFAAYLIVALVVKSLDVASVAEFTDVIPI